MTGRRETSTIPQNGILKGRFIKSKSARELAGRIKYLISYQIRPDLIQYQIFDIVSNRIKSPGNELVGEGKGQQHSGSLANQPQYVSEDSQKTYSTTASTGKRIFT
jgi:hypothetical protein